MRFEELGERCVRHARDNAGYTDRTGNLKNSIGYAVIKDGKVVRRAYISALNEKALNKVIKDNPKGVVLVVLAGMKYAVYVEAKGYNVLSATEIYARDIVEKLKT